MNDIEELRAFEGINVWAQDQETLQQQALDELNNFSESINKNEANSEVNNASKSEAVLSIETYLKRQQELGHKHLQKHNEKSKDSTAVIAEKISKCQSKLAVPTQTKRKKNVEKEATKLKTNNESDSEYLPSENDSDEEFTLKECTATRKRTRVQVNKVIDDGAIGNYEKRIEKYSANNELLENCTECVEITKDFKLPSKIYQHLYNHQRECVQWLWTLHKKGAGGLLGDDMGLGKTVQLIAFLYGLKYSNISSKKYSGVGPSIIVCPSTVIYQWVQHFHNWAPEFRVAILHDSGSYTGNKIQLIKEIHRTKGVIVTTYQGILKYRINLTSLDWQYLVLDEGHKIRNSSTKICIAVKQFKTPHRIILSGSPMQNNLQELWSLFDFINPGLLGTSQAFIEHFATPIMQGGFANATPMQEALALSMATALKNMISPYLLRRTKTEVKLEISLPNRSEQVLFCTLTDEQKELYRAFLMSTDVRNLLHKEKGRYYDYSSGCHILNGITNLRKICNHPDLFLNSKEYSDELDDVKMETNETDENFYKRSGKMIVMSALLKLWKKQNHRVLLFTQSRAMVTIIEEFLSNNSYTFLRMDGTTSIATRQSLIDKFNQDLSLDVFLLTTRVGGLGVNLTGADRVLIYDPDWNPATDTQAMERAWRIGQDKQVTIYRLLTAGTIEEKIYQRQVWKQLLSNKVLLDPKTRQFFKTSDLQDLFSLQEEFENPETANIFKNSKILLEAKRKEEEKRQKASTSKSTFSDEKIKAMRDQAALIAKQLTFDLTNKRKTKQQRDVDDNVNKIDDCHTEVSFPKALLISERASELYNDAKSSKNSADNVSDEYKLLTKVFSNDTPKIESNNLLKKKDKSKRKVDISGKIDGEKIDGLVKSEKFKRKKSKEVKTEADDYILNKLLSKKEISSALQHDKIIKYGYQAPKSIKVHTETQIRTDLALKALRKSTLNSGK